MVSVPSGKVRLAACNHTMAVLANWLTGLADCFSNFADFELERFRSQLDEKGMRVAEQQEASVKNRRKLAETTKGGLQALAVRHGWSLTDSTLKYDVDCCCLACKGSNRGCVRTPVVAEWPALMPT